MKRFKHALSSLLICFFVSQIGGQLLGEDEKNDHTNNLVELTPGQTLTRTAVGETGVTYHVYVPHNYQPTELRPLVIAFSPGGDGAGMLDKMKAGVEDAGWLLVGCDQLRNGMHDEALEIKLEDEILNDVFQHVPHDPQQIYLAGFSGGAMRAYSITARRSEPYAGVIAYGGWLGGPDFQDEPYRENMSIAMINGVQDRGANTWVPTDTKTLQSRDCTVKHFASLGGHGVAPPEITKSAVTWLQEQWDRKQQPAASSAAELVPLEILYVGESKQRTEDFKKFLAAHFRSVVTTTPESLTLDLANHADVLLVDSVVRTLPNGYSKAMLMMGSSAALTGERYGSKIDWLCQCLDNEAYLVDTSHPIFHSPVTVTPTLVEKRCPHSKLKILAWKVEEPQKRPGLVSSRKHFENASDSEIISGGVNMKGLSGVPLVREAHRFLWGFVASPQDMTEEAKQVFINSLIWIHGFDGLSQSEYSGLHGRDKIDSVLNSPYVDSDDLIRWFPQALIDQTEGDKKKIREHFEGRRAYVYVPTGSGQLQIDADAERFQTPNNDPESIEKWIELLSGDDAKTALALLHRYTNQPLRKNPKPWLEWYQKNKNQLSFSDERGYRFYTSHAKSPQDRAGNKFDTQYGAGIDELTDVSPILFDRGLVALHVVDGVAHQYAGWKATLVIKARVKPEWHFYSATEDNGTNIPTSIEVTLPAGMEFVGDWVYPESTDGQLHDGATFQREIRVGDQAHDRVMIKGKIRFQACTEKQCLQPQTLNFELPLTVMEK